MNEIKYGNNFHYKLRPETGFWESQTPTDPQSATVTIGELTSIVRDSRDHLKQLVEKAMIRLNEFDAFLEYHS